MRAVMDGVMYILSTGCQWRYLPKDFPSYSTVHRYFVWWQCESGLALIEAWGVWSISPFHPGVSLVNRSSSNGDEGLLMS
jgi:transposase